MRYDHDHSTTRPLASTLARFAASLAVVAPLVLGACGEETPSEPTPLAIAPLMAKGGNGGGNGGGGGGGGNGGGGGSTSPVPVGRLYFASDIQQFGNYDIYAVNPDGSGLVRLTSAAGDDQLPRAASSAGRIAFLSDRAATRSIYIMNTDGSNQQPVFTPDGGTLLDIALSADGTRLAFTATVAGQTDIWAINTDGTGLVRLTNDTVEERNPAWSPRGREVAYAAWVNGVSDIFELTVNNGQSRRLTNGGAGGNHNPAYTPDGRAILFSSGRDGNYELYSMRSDGSNQTRILATPGWGEYAPAVSPDGEFVAYLSQLNGGGLIGMRWTLIGNSNQTGPVSSPTDIFAVTWGL